jgi:hypothetical protein
LERILLEVRFVNLKQRLAYHYPKQVAFLAEEVDLVSLEGEEESPFPEVVEVLAFLVVVAEEVEHYLADHRVGEVEVEVVVEVAVGVEVEVELEGYY